MAINLHIAGNAGYTIISNTFIDKFMSKANGEFVKVYLYLLRCVSGIGQDITISFLADQLNQTDADIMRALRYWDKADVITLTYDSRSQLLADISFNDLTAKDNILFKNSNDKDNNTNYTNTNDNLNSVNIINKTDITTISNNAEKKSSDTKNKDYYTPAHMQELSEQEDFSMLLYAITTYMGDTLNQTSLQTIGYIYDSLGFSCELIEYLVAYCVSKGHKSMRYIEKVALNWADNDITTIREAKEATSTHNDTIYSVMNAFGITNRDPGQREKDYIKKWSDTYSFDKDIIIEACNRTLKATHQPSFEYADSILQKWKEANIKTTDDIKKADAEYELLQSKKYNKKSSSTVNNRFNNFSQRDIDIEDLESKLINKM